MLLLVVCFVSASLLCHAEGLSPESYVVNGEIVDPPHSFPWQLSLQSYGHHICGAVVYNENFALTAAHCVDSGSASQYRVACGAHNIHSSHENNRQIVGVAAIVQHSGYNPSGNGFPNDIAVLRLSSPLTLNSVCQAAQLDKGSNFDNKPGVITGWGRLAGGGALPSVLKRGDVEVLSHNTCRRYWGTVVNEQYHICVKDLGDRIFAACNGDSGGPAQVGNTVVGLASFVARGCLPYYPSAYVRVSTYIDWIESTISSM